MKSRVTVSCNPNRVKGGHDVRVLVTLSGEAPAARPPVNLALVMDRSGSMSGTPLRVAKEAARKFASVLGPADRVSIIAFDDWARLIAGPCPGGHPGIDRAIAQIETRGCTDLSAGWMLGEEMVSGGMVRGTNRVVLFTDGQANRGIVDVAPLVEMARRSAEQGVSTSCIGFGVHFNEDLLEAMARAGRGNYWYIEDAAQMVDIFASEIEHLLTYAARNVKITFTPTFPADTEIRVLSDMPYKVGTDGTAEVYVGNFYANTPTHIALELSVSGHESDIAQEIGRVAVSADMVTADGDQSQTDDIVVHVTLNGVGAIDSEVDISFIRLKVADLRGEAVQLLDQEDYGAAMELLQTAAELCVGYINHPLIVSELSDLFRQIRRVKSRSFSSVDRKRQKAYVMAVRQSKEEYLRRMKDEG